MRIKRMLLSPFPLLHSPAAGHGQTWGHGRVQGTSAGTQAVSAFQRAAPMGVGRRSSGQGVGSLREAARAHWSVSIPLKMGFVKQFLAVTCSAVVNWAWYLTLFWKVRKDMSSAVHSLLLSARALVFDKWKIYCKRNFAAITNVVWWSFWSTSWAPTHYSFLKKCCWKASCIFQEKRK